MIPTRLTIVGFVGAVQLIAAVIMLKRSQHRRYVLLARRNELTGAIAACRRA